MKKTTFANPDVRGELAALRRAAKAALRLAKATGTPCYVMKDGRIVNLNPGARRRRVAGLPFSSTPARTPLHSGRRRHAG